MRATLFALLFSVGGVCVLAALDSTVIFFLPLAVDVGVVIISSRHPHLFWFYAILISGSSLIGASITFYVGRRLGEAGIERYVSKRRLDRVLSRIREKGVVAMAALDLIPPPFPFTAVLLAAGAIDVNAVRFFVAMFGFRLLRFGVESALAARYGDQILQLLESGLVREVAEVLTVVVIAGSVFTVIRFILNTRTPYPSRSGRKAA